ncbi:MAG: transketolase, partial [Candidatus Caenarcaniphilales bacterium]|nr:transketolase [Candidatus Caenarcaniphilales bacterium]
LEIIANIRKSVLQMVHQAKSSHVGAAFSIVEILYVLYFKHMNIDPKTPAKADRDRFILSKAHASAALYSTLAHRGFFPLEYLMTYCINNGKLPGHLDKDAVPGVEISAGSLGHGLPIAVGMALADKKKNNGAKVYCIVGDGECNEGSIWEAAMLAASLKLDNLTVIIDYNKIQSFGNTNEIIDQSNIAERWSAFGFEAYELLDGHDIQALEKLFENKSEKPKAIIAHTTKGKGVSFMENKLAWHYKSPNDEELKTAIEELECAKLL